MSESLNSIGWIVLGALLADFGLHWLADRLNLKAMPASPPVAFEPLFETRDYQRTKDYLSINTRFGWMAGGIQLAAVLAFWLAGGFPVLDAWVRTLGLGTILSGLVFVGVLVVLRALIALPFSVYSTFVIEEKFGFNRTSWRTFVMDRIKGAVLACLLGAPLLAGILFFFQEAGSWAWVYSWAAVVSFMVVMQYVAPTWIMPLFNRFEPLGDAALEKAIRRYADAIDFPLQNVFVMDGSKRSGKGNAFFTGFGHNRRIVLFDTLIKQHDRDELVAIIAHEMGHYKKHHVHTGLMAAVAQTGVMFFLLSLCIAHPALFAAFYMPQPSIYAGLVLFGLLYAPVDFFTGILSMVLSRRNEYAADRFAIETTGNGEALVSALKKLSVTHLSHLSPHPFYVFLNYSHPPVLSRINAIQNQLPSP
jgi:STE24 endopeptidase